MKISRLAKILFTKIGNDEVKAISFCDTDKLDRFYSWKKQNPEIEIVEAEITPVVNNKAINGNLTGEDDVTLAAEIPVINLVTVVYEEPIDKK